MHRINPGKPQFVGWANAYGQFGQGYERVRDFRRQFLKTLAQVRAVYPQERRFLVCGFFESGGIQLPLHVVAQMFEGSVPSMAEMFSWVLTLPLKVGEMRKMPAAPP